MIAFKNFALRRGERLLLSNVDLTIHQGWRVGVVGRNGCGKSSLFAVLRGEIGADVGDIDMPTKLRIASVAQETPGLPDPAVDYVLGGDAEVARVVFAIEKAEREEDYETAANAYMELDRLGGYDARARAARLLDGLGFRADVQDRAIAEFSGGWRNRINLGRALMSPSDLLLLDEPTNHLDLDAVVWLEEWIKAYRGTLLLISHDRDFLDNVATHILHLEKGGAKLYTGNYFQFERQRSEHLRQQQIAHDREQAERARLQSFIDRFKAKASKAKQAQSRVKRLEKLQQTAAVQAEHAITATFEPPVRLPHSLLRLGDVLAGYPAAVEDEDDDSAPLHHVAHPNTDTIILRNVKQTIEAGDRIGLLGPNGEGKSTLVKTIAGSLPPIGGERIAHPDLKVGYFAQHTVDQLTKGQSALWHMQQVAPNEGEQQLRNFLGRWEFVGERVFEVVDGFSGGERARLALAMIAWTKPNLLLLDEPTNHLDLEMREALAEALGDYPGAIVLVSHDRSLLGLVCDRFERVADGKVEPFDGDLDDYAVWLKSRRSGSKGKAPPSMPAAPVRTMSPAEQKKLDVERHERERPIRKRIEKLEKMIAELQARKAALDAQLADPATYSDAGAVAKLGGEQAKVAETLAANEAEWLEAYSALEQR